MTKNDKNNVFEKKFDENEKKRKTKKKNEIFEKTFDQKIQIKKTKAKFVFRINFDEL